TVPLYPEVCRIPFIAHMPGQDAMRRTPALAQPLDLAPTILDLLGLPVPGFCDGTSLKPVLTGSAPSTREIAIAAPTLSAPGVSVPHPTRRATVTDGEW